MSERKRLVDKLTLLKANRIPRREIYGLIHDFGEARFLAAEPQVAKLLTHRNPELRYIAIMVLALHWKMKRYRRALERLLAEDSKHHVRRIAAAGLGHVLRASRDSQAIRLLLEKLCDRAEVGSVRKTAYEAILEIWFPAERDEDWDRRVDWNLVAEIRRAEGLDT